MYWWNGHRGENGGEAGRPARRLTWMAASCLVIVLGNEMTRAADSPDRDAEPVSGPFVAAFDRFARHGEVSPGVGGSLLLSELSCTACHAPANGTLGPKRGPLLNHVGSRVHPSWVAAFLRAPASVKPGTTMPDVLHALPETEKQEAIDALVAYLDSLRGSFPEIKANGLNPVPYEFWSKGDVATGKTLFHEVGCVACHAPDPAQAVSGVAPSPLDALLEELDPEEIAEMGLAAAARRVESVPLLDITAKYTAESLTHFLLDPSSVRPSGRMPSLKLLAVEAADLAAYLMQRSDLRRPADVPAVSDSDDRDDRDELVRQGRQRFVSLGCVNCHEPTGESVDLRTPLAKLDADRASSCLQDAGAKQPKYELTAAQVTALRQAMAWERTDQQQGVSGRLDQKLLQLNCHACHTRDGLGGVGRFRKPYFETVGNVDLGDEGRLPPPLTGVGRKLRQPWMKRVLAGTGDLRPYMRIRMPHFPAAVIEPLPGMLNQVDHTSAEPADLPARRDPFAAHVKPFAPGRLAAEGRRLMDVGCVQCHAFRGYALPGVIGIDLNGIDDRVHADWFHDFVLNPGDLKPRTRMPTFFPDGKSQSAAILDGNTEDQLAAIWSYLKDLDKQPLPAKIEEARSQSYELIPSDRPIVLRTFMEVAGTHAIAVGFAEGVNFAFDAEQVRLATVWRGRFLDAQGTWFSRFTPPADPLGGDLLQLETAAPLAVLGSEDEVWPAYDAANPACRFDGYRLDAEGVPTFVSRCGSFEIQDRMTPDGDRGLSRTLTIRRLPEAPTESTLWFRAASGKELRRLSPRSVAIPSGLSVEVSSGSEPLGRVRTNESGAEWIIPINVEDQTTIEVSYRW